jgi:hypothetical protein
MKGSPSAARAPGARAHPVILKTPGLFRAVVGSRK